MAKTKIAYGLDVTYHSGVSVSGAEKVTTFEELKSIALDKIKNQRDIKDIRMYKVEWTEKSYYGTTTNLGTLKGYNEKRNPFDDPSFRKWYNEMAREQD